MTPFGFTRNTRPFDHSVPRITDGSCPTMRFRTALEVLCCWKRVASPAPIEKPCQLMIELGVLVTVRVLPTVLNDALPETTAGPVGLARPSVAKQEATRAHKSFTRGARRNDDETIQFP